MPDQYYVQKAREMRELAEKARDPKTKEEFLRLAEEYDDLGRSAFRPPRRP